jgi:hypothetical protein
MSKELTGRGKRRTVAAAPPKVRPKKRPPGMSRFWEVFPRVPGDSGRYLEEDR